MTALKNDFSVERVSQELRNQFPDHELRHRDPHGRSSAMAAEEWSEDEALAPSDLSMLAQEGMNDQGLILMEEAEEKDSLISFLKTELNTFVGSNETIAQLKKRGILVAYDRAPASPEDPVGFGMHAAASYQEIMDQHPKYADWVISTYQEGQADARLNRLACWLLKAQNQQEEVSKVKPYPITAQELRDQGYLRSSKAKPKGTAPSQSASSLVSEDHTQTSVTSSSASQQVLGELLGAFKELIEEVRELRAASTPDKHRKKGASSDSDFTLVASKETK